MNDIDLDRYFSDGALRGALEARARRERAQALGGLLIAAARHLARLPGGLRRLFTKPGGGAESVS